MPEIFFITEGLSMKMQKKQRRCKRIIWTGIEKGSANPGYFAFFYATKSKPTQMKKIFITVLLISPIGLFAQNISTVEGDGKKLMVADMTSKGPITWGGYEQIGLAAQSETDGKANTAAIVAAVGNNPGYEGRPYAAKVCNSLDLGGYKDWYLPCKEETKILHANFQKLKLDEKMTLWSSTEASGTQAVSMYLYSGTFYNVQKVDPYHYVCVRKPD